MSKPKSVVNPDTVRKLTDAHEIFIMFPAPNCDEKLFAPQIELLESQGHEVTAEIGSRMFWDENPELENLNQIYAQMAQNMGPEALKNQVMQMIAVGKKDIFEGVPPNIKTVINLVVGEKDVRFRDAGDERPIKEIAQDMSDEMKEKLGGEVNLCMVEKAGHLPTIEAAQAVNEILQNSLRQTAQAAARAL